MQSQRKTEMSTNDDPYQHLTFYNNDQNNSNETQVNDKM